MAQFIGRQTQYLPFGAVKLFSPPKDELCGTNRDFCQLTEQTDDIKFQFLAAETDNIIIDGDFPSGSIDPTLGAGSWWATDWSIFNGTARHHTGIDGSLKQQNVFTANNFFRLDFTVTNMTAGNLQAVFFGQITENGTYTFYRIWTLLNLELEFRPTSEFDGRIDNVSVTQVARESDYNIDIYNHETGVFIADVPAGAVAGSTSNNVITVDFNWTNDFNLSNGCYDIRIFLAVSLFEDDFTVNQGWTLTGGVTIAGSSGPVMHYIHVAGTNSATIEILEVGDEYTITYDVLNYVSGSVTVSAGLTFGTARSANGTFTETLICTSTGFLTFGFQPTGGAGNLQVDNVVIGKADDFDGQSECFDLQTSHDCTLLFVWSNNESWGSYDYSNRFEHHLRVTSKFRGTKYPNTQNIGEDSAGVKTMDYTSLRKAKTLDIDHNPDYIHDAIASFFMQDNRSINGTSYILEDEYEPSAPNDSKNIFKDLMTARIELEETTQVNLINRNV